MIAANTQLAIQGETQERRETARHQVLAIMQFRANLKAVAEQWQAAVKQLSRTGADPYDE